MVDSLCFNRFLCEVNALTVVHCYQAAIAIRAYSAETMLTWFQCAVARG